MFNNSKIRLIIIIAFVVTMAIALSACGQPRYSTRTADVTNSIKTQLDAKQVFLVNREQSGDYSPCPSRNSGWRIVIIDKNDKRYTGLACSVYGYDTWIVSIDAASVINTK